MSGKHDIESSSASEPLYPQMQESPEFRWSFIRKVYTILTLQLLLTVAVASDVFFRHIEFIRLTTWIDVVILILIWIVLCSIPILLLILLGIYSDKHPVNYILLGLFTLSVAFVLGLACSTTKGDIILESLILTATLLVSLTTYTFWAAKRGHDFGFLYPFACGAVCVLTVFSTIQVCYPLGRIDQMIYGLVGALLMCAYIIWDTEDLIKRYTYDQFIWASVMLYLDVIKLFLLLLRIFGSSKKEEEEE